MTLLSPNFTLVEMTVTKTVLPNVPNAIHIANMKDLCEVVLEPLRKGLGAPIIIRSGFRSPEVNKAVGGAETSQHMKGQAADIVAKGVDNAAVWKYIATHLTFDQLIAEYLHEDDGSKGWVHVSYNHGKNRRQLLSKTSSSLPYQSGLHFVET